MELIEQISDLDKLPKEVYFVLGYLMRKYEGELILELLVHFLKENIDTSD